MNRAVEISTGQWVMQLDDDDYLLPGAGEAMLDAIRRAGPGESVLLFGVQIVDSDGVRRREQRFRRERYLEPKEALRRLLRNSSFVRRAHRGGAPRRHGARRACSTPPSAAPPTPTCGCGCSPATACAACPRRPVPTPSTRRRPRPACGTPATIRANGEIFDRAVAQGVVPERTIRRWQADWYHQFILAGAYRGCGWDGGPRPARCCGCSTCPRSATWACRRSGCRYGPRSRPRPSGARRKDELRRRRLTRPAPARSPASTGRCRAGTGGGRRRRRSRPPGRCTDS